MRLSVLTSTAALLLAAHASSVAAQRTTLVAAVADAGTGKPLPDAEVVIPELNRIARTNWMGEARIRDIPFGRYRLRVRKLGYAAADLYLPFEGDSIGPVFMLEPEPTTLSAVRVRANRVPPQLEPFEVRRRMAIGRFLTDSDLVREWDRPFAYVAATHFPGLQTMTNVDGELRLVSTRGACGGAVEQHGPPPPRLGAGGGGMSSGMGAGGGSGAGAVMAGSCASGSCPVKIFLDDMDLTQQDLDIVRTWDLAGVEYYTGASVPAQYRVSGSACGVLLLWSRW